MRRVHRRPFNHPWRFQLFSSPLSTALPSDPTSWQEVRLPHSWNALDTMHPGPEGHYRRGVGVYTRPYLPPEDLPPGHRVWLEVEAAAMKADVFLGDCRIGGHLGGYTSFTVELPARLHQPQPLTFHVDNRPDPQLIPSDMSDFFLYGGLTRNLWLYTTGPARIEHALFDIDVNEEEASILVRGQVIDWRPGLRLHIQLHDSDRHRVIEQTASLPAATFCIPLPPLPSPQRWSPDHPALYTAALRLMHGDEVWDEVQERLGFRSFDFPAGGPFYLNGQRLLLMGTHRHEDWAGFGSAVPEALTRQELTMIREAGFNFIRLGHYPQAPAVLDACDELGLIVWEELPWCRGGVGDETFQQQTKTMLQEMILQHYNHPSILFWGLGNELDWESEHPDSSDEKVLALLAELHALAHDLDPRRMTALRRFEPGAAVVDVYSPSIWSGWYRGRYQDYEQVLTQALARYPRLLHAEWGGDSHVGRHSQGPHLPPEAEAALARERDHSETPGLALSDAGPYRPSRDSDWSESYMLDVMEWHLQTLLRQPRLAGALQWIFKDFGTPLRPENPIPYVNQKGLVDRAARPKDLYYLFRSYLTDTPTCYIESPTWPVRVDEPNQPQRVRVYSNCGRVELFLDGRSLGSKERDPAQFPAAGLVWQVVMEPGSHRLRAVGHCADGTTISHEINQQFIPGPVGEPVGWNHRIERSRHPLTGAEALRVEVQMVDAQGRPVIHQERRVDFDVEGTHGWLVDLGIPDGSRLVETANGRASILLSPPPTAPFVLRLNAQELSVTLHLSPEPHSSTSTAP